MRLKNKKIKIENLWSQIKDKLPELDEIIKKYTNEELVVTSGNDGKHWGSKKPPDNWREMTIKEIRTYSDSLHYKDRAIDIRTWAIYALSKIKQIKFYRELRRLFPRGEFDIVKESDHIHIEFDPKPKKVKIINLRIKKIKPELIGEIKETKEPKLDVTIPFYRKRGFKRITGSIIFIAGSIMSLIPNTKAIGNIVLEFGGLLGLTGIAHSQIRRRKEGKKTIIDIIIELLQNIINWFKGFKNKE